MAFCILSKTSSFGFPSKGALPQGPLYGIPRREMPHHYSPPSFIYQSPWCMSPPPHMPGSPEVERGPHGERCLHRETFLTYLPGSPVKELPQRPPPQSLNGRSLLWNMHSISNTKVHPTTLVTLSIPLHNSTW